MTRTAPQSDGQSPGRTEHPQQTAPAKSILLVCGREGQGQLCEALAAALSGAWPGAAVAACAPDDAAAAKPADLTIRYHAAHSAADWLAGALSWQSRAGSSGQGPVIEHSVMDGVLTGESLAGFARALVRHTEFPMQTL